MYVIATLMPKSIVVQN